ncbi:MAG TPA: hypothetical protein VFG83_05065 [Kofleriaceae bacterium]|nr:hypothetical protein [Kofleriaceae bacterium]
MRKIGVGFVALAIAAFGAPRLSAACSIAGPQAYETDPDLVDDIAPGVITVTQLRITRGTGGSLGSSNSCDDLGFVYIYFDAPADNTTEPEDMGYKIKLIDGQVPDSLNIPDVAISASGWIGFVWVDGRTDDQEAISFTLAVSAVDRAGNVGPPVSVVISDPGGGGVFCQSARSIRASWPTWLVMLAALFFAARRRAPTRRRTEGHL